MSDLGQGRMPQLNTGAHYNLYDFVTIDKHLINRNRSSNQVVFVTSHRSRSHHPVFSKLRDRIPGVQGLRNLAEH